MPHPFVILGAVFSLLGVTPVLVAAADAEQVKRGEYIFRAAGCYGCHTEKKDGAIPLAGGRALKTPFGTYYGPNITPDPQNGIGKWTDQDFIRALRQGVSPAGTSYFPVFPYTSFTGMTDQDMLDLKAYLFSLKPVAQPNKPHDVSPPFGWRWLLFGWKAMFFTAGPFKPDTTKSTEFNRGAYLVNALGHCGECHTERNFLGAMDRGKPLAGNAKGPEGDKVPNITPDKETGIGDYGDKDIAYLLRTSLKPDGDAVGSSMGEVVEHGTSKLTDQDLNAISAYLRGIPAIRNQIGAAKPAGEKKKNAWD